MTRDPELDRRIADVLARLAMLSEVQGHTLEKTRSSGDENHGAIPAGVSGSATDEDRPPPIDSHLYAHFAWQFAHARSDSLRWFLVYRAESELSARKHRVPEGRTAQAPTAEDRDVMMVKLYEGWSSAEAAVAESLRAGHIREAALRKVRSTDRRDADTGRKLPGWRGKSDEDRVKAIKSYQREHPSAKAEAIASELGTSPRTIRSYMKGYQRMSGHARIGTGVRSR